MAIPPSWEISPWKRVLLAQTPSELQASQKLSPASRGMDPCRLAPDSTSSTFTSQNLGVRAVPSPILVIPIHSPTGVKVSLTPTGSVPTLSW